MRHKILKISIMLLLLIAVGVIFTLLIKYTGGWDAIQQFIINSGPAAWLIYAVIRVISIVLLSFIPGTGFTLDLIAVAIWGPTIKTYIICAGCVIAASFMLDLIGRYGGSKIIIKLIGNDDYQRARNLIRNHGVTYIPIMYLLPIFPDDAICMVAGASKMKWWLHAIYICICRNVGLAFTVFGIQFIPESIRTFTSTNLWDYFEVATILAFWFIVLFKFARFIDKKITYWRKHKNETKTK